MAVFLDKRSLYPIEDIDNVFITFLVVWILSRMLGQLLLVNLCTWEFHASPWEVQCMLITSA